MDIAPPLIVLILQDAQIEQHELMWRVILYSLVLVDLHKERPVLVRDRTSEIIDHALERLLDRRARDGQLFDIIERIAHQGHQVPRMWQHCSTA